MLDVRCGIVGTGGAIAGFGLALRSYAGTQRLNLRIQFGDFFVSQAFPVGFQIVAFKGRLGRVTVIPIAGLLHGCQLTLQIFLALDDTDKLS